MFHKVKSVTALKDYKLSVQFSEGITKIYDVKPLLEKNAIFNDLKNEDKWILTKLNNTIKSVTKNMEHYEFNNVGSEIYSFVWNDFCDNYIEFAKFSLESKTTKSVLLLYTIYTYRLHLPKIHLCNHVSSQV